MTPKGYTKTQTQSKSWNQNTCTRNIYHLSTQPDPGHHNLPYTDICSRHLLKGNNKTPNTLYFPLEKSSRPLSTKPYLPPPFPGPNPAASDNDESGNRCVPTIARQQETIGPRAFGWPSNTAIRMRAPARRSRWKALPEDCLGVWPPPVLPPEPTILLLLLPGAWKIGKTAGIL